MTMIISLAMATFELEVGEQVIHREHVTTVVDDKEVDGEVILTDRRIVLTAEKLSRRGVLSGPRILRLGLFNDWFGNLFKLATSRARMIHQIRRDDFEEAERVDPTTIYVRSQGEGYGRTWFRYMSDATTAWLDRLNVWCSGEPARPNTTVVRRPLSQLRSPESPIA